jgi:hypothetical protein
MQRIQQSEVVLAKYNFINNNNFQLMGLVCHGRNVGHKMIIRLTCTSVRQVCTKMYIIRNKTYFKKETYLLQYSFKNVVIAKSRIQDSGGKREILRSDRFLRLCASIRPGMAQAGGPPFRQKVLIISLLPPQLITVRRNSTRGTW